ncbi:MAG: hypothetical protein PHD05_00405 [Sphaerochaetaceae bacterium]|jgi:hypothetical protein|nr:hypothetical protein [Sphaerochaetaceae bacterium]
MKIKKINKNTIIPVGAIAFPLLMFFDVKGLTSKSKDFVPLTPQDVKDLTILDRNTLSMIDNDYE